MDNRRSTPEDRAAKALTERDAAVGAAVRASRREAAAIEDAHEQRSYASITLAQAIDERDAAVEVAEQARGDKAEAIEDAKEQHTEALSAQASAARALERETIAKEDAREQHVEALSAQAEADAMNTLRHLANVRTDSEEHSGNRARFGFYLLATSILAVLVVVAVWLSTR